MYEKIQLLMMQRQMNKADLSKAVGVSTGNLSDWANGRSSPSMDKLIKVADYFDVSLDYLTGRDDRFPNPTPETFELIRIYEKLDREGKAVVLGTAYIQKQRVGGENA